MHSMRVLHRLAAARPAAASLAVRATSGSASPLLASGVRSSAIRSASPLSSIRSLPHLRALSTSGGGGDFFFGEEDEEEDEAFIQYPPPTARVQGLAPTFKAAGVLHGEIADISLESYRGKYVVLFFYPKDFTYVCPTEIIAFNDRAADFATANTQLIACSTDSPESHLAWTRLPRNKGGLGSMDIPIVADITKIISAKYGVLLENEGVALRGLFIIDPEGVLQQITVNNLPIGRSVDETLRLIKALQFHEEHGEVCPANWQPGDKTIIANPNEAHQYFSTVKDADMEDAEDDEDSALAKITSKAQFHELVQSGKPVVADFMAPWCGKCAQILPFVEELAGKHPEVTFAKLDTSIPEVDQLKDELEVGAFPEFRFFKDGKEVGAKINGYKKSPLKAAVEQLL